MSRPNNSSVPHLIRTEAEYDAVLAELDRLLDGKAAPGSAADERIEFLSVLIEDYDRKHYAVPTDDITPQDVVDFVLEQREMARADLVPILGSKSRVSEFFSGKRPLSLGQITKLRAMLGLSADVLISRPPELRRSRRTRPARTARHS